MGRDAKTPRVGRMRELLEDAADCFDDGSSPFCNEWLHGHEVTASECMLLSEAVAECIRYALDNGKLPEDDGFVQNGMGLPPERRYFRMPPKVLPPDTFSVEIDTDSCELPAITIIAREI